MAPPTPKTPQSNTLLNYFSQTPKRAQEKSASTDNNNGISSEASGSTSTNDEICTTPKRVTKVSRVTDDSSSKKRKPIESPPVDPAESSRVKRPRAESPGSEFKEGTMVWAKLEGFPWWAAMVRGETPGGPFNRKNFTEFHVQFFDNPPSRAWIRKLDLKLYGGSQDGSVPPAKNDPQWIESCKSADNALLISPRKRVEKYWVHFDDGDKEASDEEEEESTPVKRSSKTRSSNSNNHKSKARKRLKVIESSDDENEKLKSETEEEEISPPAKTNGKSKSSRNKQASKNVSDDDDEYEPSPTKVAADSESEVSEECDEESDLSTHDEDNDDKNSIQSISPPKKSKTKKKENKLKVEDKDETTPSRPINSAAKARLAQFANNAEASPISSPKPSTLAAVANQISTTTTTTATLDRTEQWPHLKFQFLQPNKVQDNHRRSPSDPNYNPRTLFIPKDFLDKQTPAHRQWWLFKSQNFDTILFFKMGKFYELFHMDAVVAVEQLGISFMKGDLAHAGFPEISYSKWASALVEKGYKVARIEQTESVDAMQERIKKTKATKFEKIVNREICEISTRGVRYASFQDVSNSNPFSPDSKFLYGIVEKVSSNGPSTFGVCFVDSTIGNFHVGQFTDDRHCSRLRTLFAHHTPVQILFEKGKTSSSTQQILHNYSDVRKDPLQPESEFWGAQKLLKYLSEQTFFHSESGELLWPENFKSLLSPDDSLGLTPGEGYELGLKGLGGVVWYLKHCLLDNDLLSLKKFSIYEPVDSSLSPVEKTVVQKSCPKYMVLDGITLRNLDITDGSKTLLSVVDRCATHFGKRLLRHWICMPLAVPEEISERLDAVEELMSLGEQNDKIVSMLKTLPDLERLLNKVHYLGSAHRSKDHPDGRANFFEEVKYSKNKISDLLSILRSFKTCKKVIDLMKQNEQKIQSAVLKQLVSDFPSMDKLLEHFDNAFDHQSAAKEGKITPKPGVDEEFDSAKKAVINVQEEAEAYLKEMSKQLQTRVVYFGSDKKRFQLEVSENTKVPREFEMSSSRKGFKRYYNSKTKDFLATIMQAENLREEVLRDITRRIFEQFDQHRELWKQGVECICKLDVLMSLAAFSSSSEDMCRPRVIYSETPFINITEGRHPMTSIDTYIPNSCNLGSEKEAESPGTFVLLTGPNMGGKSTLMRQVGLLSVLSHLGCFVPATKCEMSVVDRIFTRLGANDNIGEGESTFFVEMSETSAILKHCTPNSLILMDELGRGTATYDGTAIAYAVSTALAAKRARTIFSTHYHTLVESIEHLPSIQLGHMACMVENENEDDPTQETITFLYKMVPGQCPKSYGFNAARLAGIPNEVVRVAHNKAKEFESAVNKIDLFRKICSKTKEKQLTITSTKVLFAEG